METVGAEAAQHAESWVALDDLGVGRSYKPTFGTRAYINEAHRRFVTCPTVRGLSIDIGIPGALRRQDALKLYEIAYHAPGHALDIGCGAGLSTAIIGEAMLAAGSLDHVIGVDHDANRLEVARKNLDVWGVGRVADVLCADALEACQGFVAAGVTFGLVFVDHSPVYDDMVPLCQLLPALVGQGGFVLFHDYNDRRNRDEEETGYAVYRAVQDGLARDAFDFWGVFGSCGLYRKL